MFFLLGEKPYMCNVCGQTFGGASNLYHHKKKHHPEEEEAKPCDGFDPEYQNAFSSSNSGEGQKGRPNKIKPKLQPSDPVTLPDISQFANRIKQDLQFNNHGLNKQDFPNKDLSKIKQDFSNKNNFANNNQDFPTKQDFSNTKDYSSKQDHASNKQEYYTKSDFSNKQDFPRIKQDYSNNKQEDYSNNKHDFPVKQDYISKQEYPQSKPSHKQESPIPKQDYPRIKQDYSIHGNDLYSGYKEKLEKLSRKELELADTSALRDIKPPLSSHSDLSHLPDFSHSASNHYNQDQSHLQHHPHSQSESSYHRAQSTQLHQQHRMPSSHQLVGTPTHSSHQLPISQSAEEEMCRFRQANIAEEHYRRFLAANMERAGIWAPQHQLKSQHSN